MGSLDVQAADVSIASSGRPDALRVLLAGSGITSGRGVQTHGLALVGSLQRALQSRLGRPVDVEQVSVVGATMADAAAVLGDRAGEEWDAIVIAFGLNDAMRLTPLEDWAQALERTLAKLDGDMPPGLLVPILVVGVPPMELMGLRLLRPLRSLTGRHGERLNALTRSTVARNRRTAFIPLPGMANGGERPAGSPEAYRLWAEIIATRMSSMLQAGDSRADRGAMAMQAVDRLPAAVLDDEHTAVRARLQAIVEQAAEAFDADQVLLNLLSGDRLWSVADSTGATVRAIERMSTLGGTTLRSGFLHVPDVAGDPRFADLGVVATRGLASYAGVVLRLPGGAPVGTLCLFNGGTSGPIDPAAVRRFGASAEAELAQVRLTGVRGWLQGPGAASAVSRSPRFGAGAPPPGSSSRQRRSSRRRGGPLDQRITVRADGKELARFGTRRTVPVETDTRVFGPDPIRVLVIGGDYALGYGALHRSDALDGAIARLLHTRTGRGVIVENRSEAGIRLLQLSASLGPAGAHTFDLVVWTPTFLEGARTLLRSRWVAGLELMLRRIETTSDAAVVLVGFPSLLGNQPLAVFGRARAAQINRLLSRIAARHDRVLVAEPPPIALNDVAEIEGSKVFHDTAVRILPIAMEVLAVQVVDADQ